MIRVTDRQYWIHPSMKQIMDTIIYNMGNDWDFLGLITGDGMVRVGKSMIAQQLGYYAAHKLGTPFSSKNLIFNGEELPKIGAELPKNSVIIYDEARGGLDNKKIMSHATRSLLDFFSECGMYNHLMLLVMPDFFEFPSTIATNRSEFLINVIRSSDIIAHKDEEVLRFGRGHFQFFGKDKKRKLYFEGKKQYHNYRAIKQDWWGEFRNHWVLDTEDYLKRKREFLLRDRDVGKVSNHYHAQRDALLRWVVEDLGQTQLAVSEGMRKYDGGLTQNRISMILSDKIGRYYRK